MELTLDNHPCDLGTTVCSIPGFDIAQFADIEAAREGRHLTLVIPSTPRNDALMGFVRHPHGVGPCCTEPFNTVVHTAVLSAEGTPLLEGTIRLLAASGEGYTLELRDGGARWAENAARRMLNTLGFDFSAALTPTTIFESWTNASPVKFFPVCRDTYPQQNSSQDLLPAERMLSVSDYHPFLHVATLVQSIFNEAGYRTESRFLDSDFFRSLYMSGAYPTHDTAAITARMGFCAGRLSQVTATANFLGRVYANPKLTASTVGNLVETAKPQSVDADGQTVAALYDNGGCVTRDNGKITFTPTTEVNAGFEYRLKFTTDHRILSRTQLCGFSSVYLGPGADVAFTLSNRYEDRRAEIEPNHLYRAVVFDHAAGAQYRLTCASDGATGTLCGDFAARSAQVTTPASDTVSAPILWQRKGTGWELYSGDWALYDGYIGETGQTTVEMCIRTSAERITPSSPKLFDRIYFYGAEQGMSLTLHKECSVRPLFGSTPGFGASLAFADVAALRIRQSVLLEAIAHLFNLRFYTEEPTRTVYIEPFDDFVGSGAEVDWRSRSDFSQPIVRRDVAPELHESRTWGYLAGDGAVGRFDTEADTPLGEWTFRMASRAAKQGDMQLRSPLFCPTLLAAGSYLNAPSAQLLQVGDRDDTTADGTNFTPRIVRFVGMHALPPGERWSYPSARAEYPLAAFHFAGDAAVEGFTLCFEDRDGQPGLHRYYDRQLTQESAGAHITLSLRLAPDEYAALLAPGTGAADLRSIFRIDTGQETLRAALYGVEEYRPESGLARCTFIPLDEP